MFKAPTHLPNVLVSKGSWVSFLSIGFLYFLWGFLAPDQTVETASTSDNPIESMAATTGPVSLQYASYYGSSINNVLSDVVVDAVENIYATGSTISQGFDGVVVKYNAAGQV